jgi:hypothetical protein
MANARAKSEQAEQAALKAYEFEPRLWRGVLDTTLCDKVCQ